MLNILHTSCTGLCKKKIEIHSNLWKMDRDTHIDSLKNTVILKSIYIIYLQDVHHNCSYVTIHITKTHGAEWYLQHGETVFN